MSRGMKGGNQKSKVLGWGETGDTMKQLTALHSGYLLKPPSHLWLGCHTVGPPPAHPPQSVPGW